jgi:hypothetical protein
MLSSAARSDERVLPAQFDESRRDMVAHRQHSVFAAWNGSVAIVSRGIARTVSRNAVRR